ncbi:MAG: hypothetical protein INF92_18710 [Rhodobacter sp.]|nr:hypothetical protein [Rhodobacter sp.]
MSGIPPSVWLFCACAVFALVARISVEGLESGSAALDRLPFLSLVLVSCLASAAAIYFGDSDDKQVGPQMIQAFLVGQLAMAGWIDRQTTWVPDSVLLMVLTVSSAFVFTHSIEPASVLRLIRGAGGQSAADFLGRSPVVLLVALSLAAGITIWLLTILLWGLQTLIQKEFLTPPDMVALGLPIYLLGITPETGLVYATTVCLALVMQRSEFARSVFSNPEAVKEGREHLGLDAGSPAIAVLSLMFSILAVVIVALVPLQSALGEIFSCQDPGFAGTFICP